MKEDGLILYLPFDEPDGSGVAYDYSSSRADAVLSGDAGFSRNAMKGKSFQTNEGSARTNKAIPFSSDFTLIMYVLPVTNRLGWMLNFSGIDNYQEHWIDVVPEKFPLYSRKEIVISSFTRISYRCIPFCLNPYLSAFPSMISS